MKQLTCEMCGSTNLLKQDGVFVCQDCGTKYSVEDAKKMMVEGTVDVSGSTVKVDTSAELANLYQIARRARDDENSENAAKYYDMILVKDPTSWEAAFYVVYYKALQCRIAEIRSAAISVNNCQDSVLGLIRDHVPDDEQKAAVQEVMYRSMTAANLLAAAATSHFADTSADIRENYRKEYNDRADACINIVYFCGSCIEHVFKDKPEIAAIASEVWKEGIVMEKRMTPNLSNKTEHENNMKSYAQRIGKYDPQYWEDYQHERDKVALTREIGSLRASIANTKTERKMSTGGKILIGVGIFMILMSLMLMSMHGDATIYILVGIAEVVLGYVIGMPKASVIEKNREFVADCKQKLEKKEAELAAMNKKS